MAKLWVISVPHAEQSLWTRPSAPADVILAAGDINSPATRSIERLAGIADAHPVISVPGDHEWSATGRHLGVDREARAREAARDLGIHLPTDEEVEVAGIRYLGATLWSDCAIHATPGATMVLAAHGLNAFRKIPPSRVDRGSGPTRWRSGTGHHAHGWPGGGQRDRCSLR